MAKPTDDFQQWCQRAAEARALAWGAWDGRMRRMLTEIADGYEALAQPDKKRLYRSLIEDQGSSPIPIRNSGGDAA